MRAEHASPHDDLIQALTALGEVADPERSLVDEFEPADELEDVQPEVFTPPLPEADSVELPEAEDRPAPSKRKGRFAGLAQRLFGGREDDGASDQFLDVPALEDTDFESEAEADEVELADSEAADDSRRLAEEA